MNAATPPPARGAARAVELVGPAGAGKSSIAKELAARHPDQVALRGLWGLPRRTLLRSAYALLPAAARGRAAGPRAAASAALHLARIRTLHAALDASSANAPTIAGDRGIPAERVARARPQLWLLDEGPVFGLAWLRMRHAALVGAGPLEAAWREAAELWAHTLDAIVWLDAPDAVLARRIHARQKPHLLKGAPAADVRAFAAAFRAALAGVLDEMGGGRPRVLHISTAAGAPQAAAAHIRAALEADARAI